MVSPLRSVSHFALAGVVTATLAVAPQRAAAQESLIRDTEIEEILRKDSQDIFAAAGVESKNVEIFIIGTKELNAFAAPRVMGVTTGLIIESSNPNELQGVIAHE